MTETQITAKSVSEDIVNILQPGLPFEEYKAKAEGIQVLIDQAIATATQQAVELERERNYPFRCIVEGIASGAAFSKVTGFISQHWIDSAKREVEAFEKFEALSQK